MNVMVKCLLLLTAYLLVAASSAAYAPVKGAARFGRAPLLERFAWRILDWNFPSELSKQQAIATGDYQPENALPVGIEIWRDKLFVTVPRWKDGRLL
ncbi:hypothetical protein TKK_0000885 [Trichogramma kaykai]